MQTKEQLLYYFLVKRFPLHYSDRRFFGNITTKIKNTNQITTGQAALFDKLVGKYFNNLTSIGLSVEQLLELPWACAVIQTSKEYTTAKIDLQDNVLTIRCPMNPKFIKNFEVLRDNTFFWNSKTKQYTTKFNTKSLKLALQTLPKFFTEVSICDSIQELLKDTFDKEKLVWDPTLCIIDNNYFVVASNDILNTQLNDISLSNDPNTLYHLSKLGITISDDIVKNDPYLKFASEFVTNVDVSDIEDFVRWLTNLNVDKVLMGRGVNTSYNRTNLIFTKLISLLKTANINYDFVKYTDQLARKETPILIQYHSDEKLKFFGDYAISKCVFIKNSFPVDLIDD